MTVQKELDYLRGGAEAGPDQLLQRPWEIFDKSAAGTEIKNGECARDIEIPACGFFASAEMVDQKHVGFEFLGQNNGIAWTGCRRSLSSIEHDG